MPSPTRSSPSMESHLGALAAIGTRLRALADADSAAIEVALADVQGMALDVGTWGELALAAEVARERFLTRGRQLLRAARRREEHA